ncbi:MAG: FAD-dependent oxidoreductase [Spirochaetales bacterium]|nr:FAD-dependent oxidoreductase [Spirochaetales bacterium]
MSINREQLVIVGNGMCGGKLVEELILKNTSKYQITIIGNEASDNYNRIKLVYKLKTDDVDDFYLTTKVWYEEHGVNCILNNAVTRIDREKKRVALENGTSVAYDKLVLAVGSSPFIPPIKGLEMPGVMTMRTLEDVEKIKKFLMGKTHVMVIGGGLLGLEQAIALKSMGKIVTVSHIMDTLMELQLYKESSDFLRKKLETKGIRFVMGTYVTELKGTTGGVESAVFHNGETVPTEMILISTGIRPNIQLAESCGLDVNKGIIINRFLQTKDPNIYAIGECSEYKGKTWGLVAPVYEQARVLAGVLSDEDVEFIVPELPPTHLKSDIPVITMGSLDYDDSYEKVVYSDPNSLIYKQLIIKENKLVGANIIGEDLNSDAISLHYTAKLPLPERRADLLFPGAGAGEAMLDASAWPDDTKICDCNGINAGMIREVIKKGNDTLYKAVNASRAGTGCGNCKNKVKAILIDELGELKDDPADHYFVPGIPKTRKELEEYILAHNLKAVSEVLQSIEGSVDDVKTQMGLDFLLHFVWKGKYTVEKRARFVNDRYYGNVQKDGKFSVIPIIPGGVSSPAILENIAAVAKEYNATIKITGADRIGLYSIEKKDLKEVWKKLHSHSGHAYSKAFRAAKSCVGAEFCRWGLGNSMKLGERMGRRYSGTTGPAKFKMGVSGCPRNCAEATIKDLGVVAVEGGWDIYIGGNAGSKAVPAVKLARVQTEDEVIKIADRFYEYYRRHGKFGERSVHFLGRLGLETISEAILSDTDKNLKQLETDFIEMLDNYQDPWVLEEDLLNEVIIDKPIENHELYIEDAASIKPGESRLYIAKNGEVVIFRATQGDWIATESRCPHEKGPIVDCMLGDGKLTCPIHNYSYDAKTGQCSNDAINPLKIYKVIEEKNRLKIVF